MWRMFTGVAAGGGGGRGRAPRNQKVRRGRPPDSRIKWHKSGVCDFGCMLAPLPAIRPPNQKSVVTPLRTLLLVRQIAFQTWAAVIEWRVPSHRRQPGSRLSGGGRTVPGRMAEYHGDCVGGPSGLSGSACSDDGPVQGPQLCWISHTPPSRRIQGRPFRLGGRNIVASGAPPWGGGGRRRRDVAMSPQWPMRP